MTIRDEDLLRCISDARDVWLDTMPEAAPDHNFSRQFRRKVWLSRFQAYRLYYRHPIRRFFKGLGIWLMMMLFILALYPFEHRASDISFMREADRLIIRMDDDFTMMEDLEASLLLPQTIPLAETDRTIEVDDLSIFPGGADSFYGSIYGGMGDALNQLRMAVLFEIDFYAEETLLGTIIAVTPRDAVSLEDGKVITGWNLFADFDGCPVVFRRGSKYFCMFDASDVLKPLLSAAIQ